MNRSRNQVLAALAVVVVLAAALGIRWSGREGRSPVSPARPPLTRFDKPAPPARVPLPIHFESPGVPCWACSEGETWPIRFRTNLDVLAPLGDGPANAALWLKDFAKPRGPRLREAETALERRVKGPGTLGLVLSGDDPLLKEAEPWADQATMRFYPDVWAPEGFSTPIPNLVVAISLAKSWAARAASNPDAPTAIEDCRRAIRWGRLLRQEDATIIQDLIGLASIRIGAEQLYALAARRGDQPLMLAAAIVQGEVAPQRLRTAQFETRMAYWAERKSVVTDRKVEDWVGVAKRPPDRRFGLEAVCSLGFARLEGNAAQRGKAEQALVELKASSDPFVAGYARWALEIRRAEFRSALGS